MVAIYVQYNAINRNTKLN